ncbi:MAG: hypothetical protein ACRC6X_00460 [Culicoidibacterales bacterium]
MGVHFKLEDNMLGVCLECGTMVINGEQGCVDYTTGLLDGLLAVGLDKQLVKMANIAYKIQHFSFFGLEDKEVFEQLTELTFFLSCGEKLKSVDKAILDSQLETVFFYPRKTLSSISFVAVDREEELMQKEHLLLQYIADIVSSYSEYEEVISKLI